MNDAMHRSIADWLQEGPERGPHEGLERTLAATRRTSQRPAWTIPERWIPMHLTMDRLSGPRPVGPLLIIGLVLASLIAGALLYIGSRPRMPEPFGPAANGLVAYDAGGAIYLAESDGTATRMVDGGLGWNFSPSFSPDGMRLAYWSAPDASSRSRRLFVTDVDARGPARQVSGELINPLNYVVGASWSPDGRSVAFSAIDPTAPAADGSRIYIAALDGTDPKAITAPGAAAPWSPVFSPDGSWLAFRSGRPDADLMIVRPDGSDLRTLVSVGIDTDAFVNIAWSPDSRRIVYHRPDPTTGTNVVETVDLDGRTSRLSRDGEGSSDPSWSPDGGLIAFAFEAAPGVGHVAVVAPDGTAFRDLGPVGGCLMSWSPDSRYLFGYTGASDGCFIAKLTRVPVDDPAGAVVFDIAGATVGTSSWQRLAP
jgi:Tol biopolymer transport system component